jgi:hypothetical protein
MWGELSDERTDLPFTISAGSRQRSHSWVIVPRDSWPYFTVSDSRLPQPGGPGPRIYKSQGQGVPVIPPGTGFPFHRLLRLAELRWRYSNPPPRRVLNISESESESHCDWRSVSLSVLVSSPVRGSWPDISYCLTISVLSLGGGALSDEMVGLSFIRVCQQ